MLGRSLHLHSASGTRGANCGTACRWSTVQWWSVSIPSRNISMIRACAFTYLARRVWLPGFRNSRINV